MMCTFETRTLFGCIYFLALCFVCLVDPCTGNFGIRLPVPVPNIIPDATPSPIPDPASLAKPIFDASAKTIEGDNIIHSLGNGARNLASASVETMATSLKEATQSVPGFNNVVNAAQSVIPAAALGVESVNVATTKEEPESILKGTPSQHVRSKQYDWGARCRLWTAPLGISLVVAPTGSKRARLFCIALLLLLVVPAAVLGQCDNCTDAISSPSCPYPELCGLASISCINCSSIPSSGCPHPEWCVNVTCSSMCMPGMPMDGCQDPGACGFRPTACNGCIVGKSTAGCPNPQWCTACADPAKCPPHNTPPCWKCKSGESTRDCPNSTDCGLLPPSPSCVGCVVNGSTAGCPNVTVCGGHATFPCLGCVADSVTQGCPDPSWCNLAPACFGCTTAITGNVGCPNPVACGVAVSLPCINCMEGMYMDTCPFPQLCPAGGNSSAGSCPMSMAFSVSSSVCVLLSSWYVQDAAQWTLLVLGVLMLAVTREFFVVHRQHRARVRRLDSIDQTISATDNAQALSSDDHGAGSERFHEAWPSSTRGAALPPLVPVALLEDCAYYAITVACAYLLMLLVMTYNVALFLLVVALSAVAHLVIKVAFVAYGRSATRGAVAGSSGWSKFTEGDPTATTDRSYVAPLSVDEVKAASDPCCADVDSDLE